MDCFTPLRKVLVLSVMSIGVLYFAGCAGSRPQPSDMTGVAAGPAAPPADVPTPEEATAFVDSAEAVLHDLGVKASRAAWVQSTYIIPDTEILAAEANEAYVSAATALAAEAPRYAGLDLPYDVARRLEILRRSLSMPAPQDPDKTEELTRIASRMESTYGKGEYCPPGGGECLDLQEMTRILANSRDPDSLLLVWEGWRTVSVPMRDDYERFVELTNEGARSLGFEDLGAMWRSNYDMPPDAFAEELERLWNQVRPLYESLHCYVRAELGAYYGTDLVPPDEPIPAHLLGNMWAQDWSTIYSLVAPENADPGYDLTERLRTEGVGAIEMVEYGERFFSSLGFEPLPETFWERSLFEKPEDRDVVCHASAWNVDDVDDLRIKMCIDITAEDFQTVHHELGHNYYQRAYNEQPYLYRGSANDGFHEALGDAVALSVTPEYLVEIGLLGEAPPPSKDIGLLLRDALSKVAFLPFGLMVDQWRWKVFSGEIAPDEYNQAWWDLREQYQGVQAPVPRTEEYFDPGAKYHIPANVPYTRYFLAAILQYQFHEALCEAAGYEGPLNRCSIYGSEQAGERLRAMMELGLSRPWPEALEMLTGSRELDASALLEYFAQLKAWLEEQNENWACGW